MKETDFVEQNKDKWQEFENELKQSNPKPDRISHFYVETIDDLSFARTHYPNRLVRTYLNGLAETLSLQIQKSQKNYRKSFIQFWKRDFPLMMFEARNQFFLSFLILAISIGIGVFSSMHDPSFANYILGDAYVETTLANIEKGDPMAIYKDQSRANMFLGITLNNIFVSVRTFLLSLFAGAGTIIIIMYNGVMIGVFQYFFIERGLFFESFLTIWQHGVIEISCIVLAGAAGLVLAKGVLFPGTYSRLNAFRIAGKKSLVIMLGLMPLLVYSGAIEAFVTRYTDIHWSIRLFSILITLAFVIGYFIWYPRKVAAGLNANQTFKAYISPIRFSHFSFGTTQKNAALIWESLRMLSLYHKKILWVFALAMTCLIASIYFIEKFGHSLFFDFSAVGVVSFFRGNNLPIFMSNFVFLIVAFILSQRINIIHAEKAGLNIPSWKSSRLRIILVAFVSAAVLSLCLTNGYLFLPVLFLLPFLGYIMVSTLHSDGKTNLKKFKNYLFSSFGKLLLMTLTLSGVTLLGGILINFVVSQLFMTFIGSFIYELDSSTIIYFFMSYIPLAVLLMGSYLVLFTAYGLAYFSIKESQTAEHLRMRIEDSFPLNDGQPIQKTNLLSNNRLNTI